MTKPSRAFLSHGKSSHFSIGYMAKISILSAISVILMFFDIPLWFAPSFYKIDLSEVSVLIGAFALGPLAGVCIELIKVLLELLLKGTTTAGVGEFANFVIGCSFVLPAAWIYRQKKSVQRAILGMGVGILVMTVIGSLLNLYLLLPVYSVAYGMPIDALVAAGTAVNPAITSMETLVLFATAPFNLLKGVLSSLICLVLYKHISPLLHR